MRPLVCLLALLEIVNARPAHAKDPHRSLVLLLPKPHELDEQRVNTAIARAFELKLPRDNDKGYAVPAGRGRYLAKAEGQMLLVHSIAGVYVDPEPMANQFPDRRLQTALRAHRAWMAVDLLEAKDAAAVRRGYATAGKLLAELAPPGALAIYGTESQRWWPFTPEAHEALRAADPVSALQQQMPVPVLAVEKNDPEMRAAVAKARRTWPEFVAVFRKAPKDMRFSAKAPFSEKDETEFMWVLVERIEGDQVEGTLGNQPDTLKGLHEGDRVRFRVTDLNDWLMIGKDGKVQGGYTVDVLGKRMGAPLLPR